MLIKYLALYTANTRRFREIVQKGIYLANGLLQYHPTFKYITWFTGKKVILKSYLQLEIRSSKDLRKNQETRKMAYTGILLSISCMCIYISTFQN